MIDVSQPIRAAITDGQPHVEVRPEFLSDDQLAALGRALDDIGVNVAVRTRRSRDC